MITFADDEIAIERMLAEPRYAILEMLARPRGATIDEIREPLGWERHTARGYLSRHINHGGVPVRSDMVGGLGLKLLVLRKIKAFGRTAALGLGIALTLRQRRPVRRQYDFFALCAQDQANVRRSGSDLEHARRSARSYSRAFIEQPLPMASTVLASHHTGHLHLFGLESRPWRKCGQLAEYRRYRIGVSHMCRS